MPPVLTTAQPVDPRERLIHEGLVPVPDAALAVLGKRIDSRTALRWSIHGKRGHRLLTLRGARGVRLTSVAEMRRWLIATQSDPLPPQVPAGLDVVEADKVLAAFGLPRGGA